MMDILTRHHVLYSKEVEALRLQRLLPADHRGQASASALLMMEYLRARNWCPAAVMDLLSRENLDHVYCAAAIVCCRNDVKHDLCSTISGCSAFNVDHKDVSPKHLKKSCTCIKTRLNEDFVRPAMDEVYRILEQGAVPLAELSEDDFGRVRMKVVPRDSEKKYVATSHVWVNGLCSSLSNGLFQCQLNSIFKTVQKSGKNLSPISMYSVESLEDLFFLPEERIRIWIDALCIPVHDEKGAERSIALRQQAINSMSKIYAGAEAVLVLDDGLDYLNGLQSYECSNMTMSYAIRYISWMGRCWTLPEGILAQYLYFRCRSSDDVVSKPDRLWGGKELMILNP